MMRHFYNITVTDINICFTKILNFEWVFIRDITGQFSIPEIYFELSVGMSEPLPPSKNLKLFSLGSPMRNVDFLEQNVYKLDINVRRMCEVYKQIRITIAFKT